MGRNVKADIVVFEVVIVDTGDVCFTVVAVVEAVAACEEVAVDGAADGFDIGGALYILVLVARHTAGVANIIVASHVAADVAAAIDGAHVAVGYLRPGAV